MSLVAGVDIGNATTEVALARVTGAGIAFLASSTIPTTGIKGTEANLQGVLDDVPSTFGTPYRTVRIPMPPSTGGMFPPNARPCGSSDRHNGPSQQATRSDYQSLMLLDLFSVLQHPVS